MENIIETKKPQEQEEKAVSKVDEKVQEVYKLLKKYANSTERKAWLRARNRNWDAAFESQIWTDKEKKEMTEAGMIPLSINDLYKGIQGSAAVATDQRPGIKFVPIGSSDLYTAELLTRAHDKVSAQNELQDEIYTFVEECKTGSLGTVEVTHDKSKGDLRAGSIVISQMDPTYLYYDMTEAKKSSLADTHLIKAHKITIEEALEKYEGIKEADLEYDGGVEEASGSQNKPDTYNTGEDNYAGAGSDLPETENKKTVWEIEAHLLKKERVYILWAEGHTKPVTYKKEQKADAEQDRALLLGAGVKAEIYTRLIEKRYLRIIVGSKLIDELENPYGVDSEGVPILNIITIVHNRTRKGRPVGPTDYALELCRERNKRRAQAIHQASENLNAPIVLQEGYRFEKTKFGNVLVIPKDASFPPSRLTPGSVTAEVMNLEQVAKADLDDMYDLQDVMRGKIPPGDPSGRTILALQDSAGTMSRPFIRKLEQALIRIGKCEMSLILSTWTREMWARLIEPDEMQNWLPPEMRGTSEEEQPGADEIAQRWMAALDQVSPVDGSAPLSIINVDVQIVAGSTMPTNRIAKATMAMDMVKIGMFDARAGLHYIDDPEADKIADRLESKEQAAITAGALK